jgi:hypothetical protein
MKYHILVFPRSKEGVLQEGAHAKLGSFPGIKLCEGELPLGEGVAMPGGAFHYTWDAIRGASHRTSRGPPESGNSRRHGESHSARDLQERFDASGKMG